MTKYSLHTILFLGACAFALPVCAQTVLYPGQGVQVNPGASPSYLLYPGNKYGRVVPPLLEPGQKGIGVIHLHKPPPHRTHVAAKPAAPPVETAAEETARVAQGELPQDQGLKDATPAARKAAPAQAAAAEPVPDAQTATNGAATIPFSFDSSSPVPPAAQPATPQKPAPATKLADTEPAPRTTTPSPARATGAAKDAEHAGLTRRSQIIFPQNATDPTLSELGSLKGLASTLASALQSGAQRVQLEAYGGPRGDKSSDARRISLKRALAIRQLLIDDGVPAEKIDVRALGGADDKGPADRVDVFVRAG